LFLVPPFLGIGQTGKGHECPEEYGHGQNDGACLLDVLPGALPCVDEEPPKRGQTVRRKFEEKRSAGPPQDGGSEELGQQEGQDPGKNGQKKHHLGMPGGEESGDEHGEHRELGAAVHERSSEKGGQALARAAKGPGGHDAGDGAPPRNPAGNDVGHHGISMEPEGSKDPVQHVGDPGQVAGVFEEGNGQKHEQDEGDKSQDSPDPVNDAREDQGLERTLGQNTLHDLAQPRESGFQPGHGNGTVGESELVDSVENRHHDHGTQEPVGQHPVELVRKVQAVGLPAPSYHGAFEQGRDVPVTVIGDDGLRVGGQRLLQVIPDGFGHVLESGRELGVLLPAPLHHLLVGFQVLQGRPARGVQMRKKSCGLDESFHSLEDGIDVRSVGNRQGDPRTLLPGQVLGPGKDLFFAFSRSSNGGDHRDAQPPGQLVGIDFDAAIGGGVDHVQGEHQGDPQLQQLDGQVEVSFKVGSVHDVDDRRRPFVDQHIPGHEFFGRIGGEGVGPRKIHQPNGKAVEGTKAFLLLDGDAGIVPHVLPCPGHGIEQGGLAAVGIPGQGNQEWSRRLMHGRPPPRPR